MAKHVFKSTIDTRPIAIEDMLETRPGGLIKTTKYPADVMVFEGPFNRIEQPTMILELISQARWLADSSKISDKQEAADIMTRILLNDFD